MTTLIETPTLPGDRNRPGGAQRPRRVTGNTLPAPLYPQLRPRPYHSTLDRVAVHQRARLQAAMIDLVSRKGYAEVTTRELCALAGVSTRTMYQQFASKDECFLATCETIVGQTAKRIVSVCGGRPDRPSGLHRAVDAFIAEIVEHPKSWRMVLVELRGAASVEGLDRFDQACVQPLERTFTHAAGRSVLPSVLAKGTVHGLLQVASSRLLEDKPQAISVARRELSKWMAAYHSPAVRQVNDVALTPQARSRRTAAAKATVIIGDKRTRMLRAALHIAGTSGYPGLTAREVAYVAGVRQDEFAAEFGSAEECFSASVEFFIALVIMRALRASSGAPDWSVVCRAVRSLFDQLAGDPVLARALLPEISGCGVAWVEHRTALTGSLARLLLRRASRSTPLTAMTAEAIAGAVCGIAHHHAVHGRMRLLPLLSGHVAYLVLAPIIGAERAVQAILTEHDTQEGIKPVTMRTPQP